MTAVKATAMGISRRYDASLQPLPVVVTELDDIVRDPAVRGANGVLPGSIHLNGQFTQKATESQLDGQHPSSTSPAGGNAGNGSEVDGLAVTAQLKGAQAVIWSLWDVNDTHTGWLMADFYRRWAAGVATSPKPTRSARRNLTCSTTRRDTPAQPDAALQCSPTMPHKFLPASHHTTGLLLYSWGTGNSSSNYNRIQLDLVPAPAALEVRMPDPDLSNRNYILDRGDPIVLGIKSCRHVTDNMHRERTVGAFAV